MKTPSDQETSVVYFKRIDLGPKWKRKFALKIKNDSEEEVFSPSESSSKFLLRIR